MTTGTVGITIVTSDNRATCSISNGSNTSNDGTRTTSSRTGGSSRTHEVGNSTTWDGRGGLSDTRTQVENLVSSACGTDTSGGRVSSTT